MEIPDPGPWPTTPEDAVAEQERLRPLLDLDPPPAPEPATVAGLDVSYAGDGGGTGARLAAAVVVLDLATLEPVEESVAVGTSAFPYAPGLLAFRELPALLDALRALRTVPDVLVCDGYGRTHPRRFGLACHLGVLTGLPTFGVAKTPFIGTHTAPGTARGSLAPLVDDGETVGRALRTRDGVKPVYVSVGHRITLDDACALTLRLAPEFRLPETTRRADRLSRDTLAG